VRIRAEGPGKIRGVLEPSDPIVLVEVDGTVVAGPVFWDGDSSRPEVTFIYQGSLVRGWCVGVLRADGVLAWQTEVQVGSLYPGGSVTVTLAGMMEPETLLTAEDHEWLRGQAC
jgi:hypothetical protein